MRLLTARSLSKNTFDSLVCEWGDRVRKAEPVARAEDLYQGRAFLEARKLSELTGSPFYVVSAGLGLVRADAEIPSYGLTVSVGSPDSIQNRCNEGKLSAALWWTALTAEFGSRNPLSELIGAARNSLWLLALPIGYFELVSEDLSQLSDSQLECVRIIGPQIDKGKNRVLSACLLNVDDRLNGPDSPLPGTQTDFAQRAARFAYDTVIRRNPSGDIIAHRRAILRRLSGLRPAKRFKRQLMSDVAIIEKIQTLWDEVGGQSSKMLRVLRDREDIACEQGRFRNLFKLVQKDFNS